MLVWTRTKDGEHNGKPCYDYHATCEDRTYHITWAYDAGFGYTATRENPYDKATEYLFLPGCSRVHGISWARTLKRCKARCEEIDAAFLGKTLPTMLLKPNVAGMFTSFEDWVNRAKHCLANRTCESSGSTMPVPAMCVDTKGRRCYQGSDFMRARDENAFPVIYFWDCK